MAAKKKTPFVRLAAPLLLSFLLVACTGINPPARAERPQVIRAEAAMPLSIQAENELAGTSGWRTKSQSTDADLAGYVSPIAAPAGSYLRLFVDSPRADFSVQIFRIGWYGGAGARLIATSQKFAARTQPRCNFTAELRSVSCENWEVSALIDTQNWPAGMYLAKLRGNGKETLAPFIIRSTDLAGRQVVLAATATWAAYNRYGGYSLYKGPDGKRDSRAYRASFQRPFAGESQKFFQNWDLGLIQWIESQGQNLAYLDSFALERNGANLRKASSVISLGHDEYWSIPMRQSLDGAIDAGVNVAFLGANAMWWRIRFSPEGKNLYCYKDRELDPVQGPRTSVNFISAPAPDPQNRTVGANYLCSHPTGAWPLLIQRPSSPLFAGIERETMEKLEGLVTGEMDYVQQNATTPAGLVVLANSPVVCKNQPLVAQMTIYPGRGGGAVFNAATFGIAWSFIPEMQKERGISAQGREFSEKLVANLLDAYAQPRAAGRLHLPAPTASK